MWPGLEWPVVSRVSSGRVKAAVLPVPVWSDADQVFA